MKPILRAAGVLDHQLDIVPREYKTKTLAVAFDWLHDIYLSNEYDRVVKIWTSVTPEVWENYKLLGVENLTEQRLLLQTVWILWRNIVTRNIMKIIISTDGYEIKVSDCDYVLLNS